MNQATFEASYRAFILACTIKHHIEKKDSNLKTFEMLNSSLFVDDLLSCETNVAEALKLTTESVNILKERGINLRIFERRCYFKLEKSLKNYHLRRLQLLIHRHSSDHYFVIRMQSFRDRFFVKTLPLDTIWEYGTFYY